MDRKDTDEAVFGSVSFDITEKLELTGGIRFFKAENTVKGSLASDWVQPGRAWSGTDDEARSAGRAGHSANGGKAHFHRSARPGRRNGEWRCPSQADFKDAPCKNVDRQGKASTSAAST